MAKFCSQCGRPLQDGEVCTCSQQAGGAAEQKTAAPQGQPSGYGQTTAPQGQPYGGPQGQPYGGPQGQPYGGPQGQPYGGPQGQPYGGPQGQPGGYGQPYGGPQGQPGGYGQPYGGPQGQPGGYGQPYGGPQMPRQVGAAGVYMKGLWATILEAWGKPGETLSGMTEAGKAPVVFGICGIQSILFSFIFMFTGLRVNMAVTSVARNYGYSGSVPKAVNTPAMFFISLLGAFCVLICWGAVAMLFGGRGNKRMSFMQGLGVAAAKALAQMPFTAVAAVIALIFPIMSQNDVNPIPMAIAFLIYSVGSLLVYFFVPAAIDTFLAEDKNKRVWQLFFLFFVNTIVSTILAIIFGAMMGGSLSQLL